MTLAFFLPLVGQYAPQGGRAPRLPAPWSGDAHLPQVPGDTEEARSRLEVGREDLRDHRGLRLVETHPRRLAWSVGVDLKTVGGVRPRQQKPRFVLGQPSPAHPLREQRPLVLGHGSPYLQEQLVVRLGAHRSLHQLHPAASLLELLDEDHLVNLPLRARRSGESTTMISNSLKRALSRRASRAGRFSVVPL